METRRAPALPPGIDLDAYLAAGGIPPGALILSETGSAPVVVTVADGATPERYASPAERAARSALFPGTRLSAIADPRVAGVASARHPILALTDQMRGGGYEHDVQLLVLHTMRRYYPTLDAAIRFRRVLEGDVVVTSDDEGLQRALQEWWAGVPVGYLDGAASLRGGDTYLDTLASAADEYGLAVGEVLADEAGREVERLVVPNVRTLSTEEVPGTRGRPGGRRYRLVQNQDGKRVPVEGPLVQTLAFRGALERPWPEPLAWSLVQTTEVVLRMVQSVQQSWWRFGDPSLLVSIEYDGKTETGPELVDVDQPDGTSVEVPADLVMAKETIEHVMNARRRGMVGDAYSSVIGGKIRQEVLGDVNATMMRFFREQRSVFDADMVAQSEVPVWMYPTVDRPGDGLGGSLSNNQNAICSEAARKRNEKLLPLAKRVIETKLLMDGDARHIGRFDVEASMVNILDEKLIEETRLAAAQAEAAVIENAVSLYEDDGTPRFSGEALRYLEEREVL